MANIVRGSAANMKQRRVRMQSGDQSPILTVFGNPPALVRVENEEHLYLAQAIADAQGGILVATPTRTIMATPAKGQVNYRGPSAPAQVATPAQTGQPTGILQADRLPIPSNGNGSHAQAAAAPGMCGRCGGSGHTTRGVCPVCRGTKVAR